MEIVSIRYSLPVQVFWFISTLIEGYFIYQLFVHYTQPRQKFICKMILFVNFAVSGTMTIWIGDHNLILTAPVFIVLGMLCTGGDRFARLSVIFTVFCMEMSVSAFLDTYLKGEWHGDILRFRIYPAAGRIIICSLVFFALKRKLPKKSALLPKRLWKVIFGLSLLPLSTLIAVVSLAYGRYFSNIANIQAMYMGIIILPFIFLTSFAILAVISVLADHEQLERAKQLVGMREAYYQNLKQQEDGIRHLRHDMKNHLSTIRALIADQNEEGAVSYLDTLLDSVSCPPARRADIGGCPAVINDTKRFCENEAANALLQTKADFILQNGLDYDFRVHLQKEISISDIDLCALIGNALDNAARAAVSAKDRTITLRCRCDKGIFMMKVANCFGGEIDRELKTTKPDSERHGFGIPGMKEIAARYGGSLETQVEGHTFILIVYLYL